MGYTLSIPDGEYENVGLTDAIGAITADEPRLALVNHLKPGYNNDDVLDTYLVLGVTTIGGLGFVILRPESDLENSDEENILVLGANTVLSIEFQEKQ